MYFMEFRQSAKDNLLLFRQMWTDKSQLAICSFNLPCLHQSLFLSFSISPLGTLFASICLVCKADAEPINYMRRVICTAACRYLCLVHLCALLAQLHFAFNMPL